MKKSVAMLGSVLLSLGTLSYAGDLASGKALSGQCKVCHGNNGIAKDPSAPNLAGLSEFYLEKSMQDFKKGLRKDPRMGIVAQALSDEQIKDLAAWYAAFEITVVEPEL